MKPMKLVQTELSYSNIGMTAVMICDSSESKNIAKKCRKPSIFAYSYIFNDIFRKFFIFRSFKFDFNGFYSKNTKFNDVKLYDSKYE